MECAILDGWRYLGKDATAVLSYTPREFTIMLRGQQERQFDEYERMAYAAMMNRQAYHATKLKPSDLFKRPKNAEAAQKHLEDRSEMAQHASEWLAQFKFG